MHVGEGNQHGRPREVVSESSGVEGWIHAERREIEQGSKHDGWKSHGVDAGDAVGSVSAHVTILYGGDVPNHEAREDEEDCDCALCIVQKRRRPAGREAFVGEVADGNGESGQKTNYIKEDGGAGGKILGP